MPHLSRTLLGPLALAITLALQIVAAPVASAGPGPSKVKTSKATNKRATSKAAKIRASRTAPRGTAGRRTATTSLRLRGAGVGRTKLDAQPSAPLKKAKLKSATKAAAKTKATGKTRRATVKTKAAAAKRKSIANRKATAKPAPKTAGKTSRWQKPLKATQAGLAKLKANPQIARALKFASKVSTKITRTLDGWQARAPPWLASSMSALRTYTLPSIAAYTFSRVKNDKAFLGTYLVSNSIVSNVLLPASIAIGMDPVLSAVLNALTTPITIGVVVLRERHNRLKAGESITVKETAKLVGREYRDFAKARRETSSKAAQAAAPRAAAPRAAAVN